jgi:DNA-binding transcriptional ArsR family regulator
MLMIDASVFDRDDVLLFFNGEYSRKTALATFAAPDISWVAWKVDGRIHLRLWTKNEYKATANLIKILGVRPSRRAFKPRKKRRAPLLITDLSIMDALVDDPKVPFGELLKTTGLSPKTIRKHLNRLLETKTISIDPLLGALTDSGELIYPLVVDGSVSMDDVRKIMGESAQTHHTLEPPMKHVLCRASSLADESGSAGLYRPQTLPNQGGNKEAGKEAKEIAESLKLTTCVNPHYDNTKSCWCQIAETLLVPPYIQKD